MTWMVRNSRGHPDALLTFAVWAVFVVLAKLLASGVVIEGYVLGTIDAGIIAAVLTPTIGAYTAKRIAGGKPDKDGTP